jgi:hypothetical protein
MSTSWPSMLTLLVVVCSGRVPRQSGFGTSEASVQVGNFRLSGQYCRVGS